MTLRILQLADNPYLGGVTSHLLQAITALDDRGVVCHLAALPGHGDEDVLSPAAARLGFPVETLPMAGRFDPRVLRVLRRRVRELGVQLVHVHGYRGVAIASPAVVGVPVICTCHGQAVEPALRTRVWQASSLQIMRRHPRTIAASAFVGDWLASRGLEPARIRVVRNGVSAGGGTSVWPAPAAIEGSDLRVLYAGRLAAGKGVEGLIEAVSGVPGAALVVAGDGPLRPRLEERAGELGLPAVFTGRAAEMGPLYRAADVVALPSTMEALPMTLVEAAAHGKPVVACRVGGIPEVVVDGETGILVPGESPSALSDALKQLSSAALRRKMGHAARRRWEGHFTAAGMARELEAVYRSVLDV